MEEIKSILANLNLPVRQLQDLYVQGSNCGIFDL